jgi:hypothetical protein
MPLLPLFALLLALALPSAAHGAANLELGIQDDAVLFERHYSDASMGLDRAAQMGADRIRVNLEWAESMPAGQARRKKAPAQVSWDFSRLEQLYADATARGLRLQVTLTGPAPRWATGNRRISNVRPKPRAFAQFASAVATAFAGRIDRYSTWNEPNWHSRLQPARANARIYRALHAHAYEAIKRADPRAAVLIGELAPGASSKLSTTALRFVRGIGCLDGNYRSKRRCALLKADGFAIHPYNFARRPRAARNPNRDVVEIGSLSRLTTALDRLHARKRLRTPSGAKMPLYLTEFGYFTKGPLRLKPKRHAQWLTEAWRIAERNPRVKQLLQYGLVDPWPRRVTWRTAVLNRDGSPRPAYHALAKLAR